MKQLESMNWVWQNQKIKKYLIMPQIEIWSYILAYTQSNKPSVVIFRLQDPSPEHVNSLLSSNLPRINEDLMKGSIVIIEDFEIRVRKLPIIEEQ
ncbi:MAG: hypothetical protein E4G94_09980 [ANME-2 cluster archaeon]|nr:MAG: hypothetical protein E4G94_09980 [ANME-2 cluster archaeon]